MTTEGLAGRDELTLAVQSLIMEVRQLNSKLALYAPREEVKTDSRRRAWRFLGFSVVIVLLAQMLSMTTISYCFLDANADRKPLCGVMPGYNEALAQGEVRLQRFELLVTTIEKNRVEIEKLNEEVADLQAEQKKP